MRTEKEKLLLKYPNNEAVINGLPFLRKADFDFKDLESSQEFTIMFNFVCISVLSVDP